MNETSDKTELRTVDSDDYQVRRILLECCSRLGVENLSPVEECRTLDVAEFLSDKLRQILTEKNPKL